MKKRKKILVVSMMLISISMTMIYMGTNMSANETDIVQVAFTNDNIDKESVQIHAKAQCLDGYEIKAMQVEDQERLDNVSEIDFSATENKEYTVTVYYQSLTDQKELSQIFTTAVNSIVKESYDTSLLDDSSDIITTSDGYTFDKSTGTIKKYTEQPNVTEIEIPSSIDGVEVKNIGYQSFFDCRILKKINIPNSVSKIYASAFDCCENLEEINIPKSITTIEDRTFMNCMSLERIDIPDGVKSIGIYAFANSGLINVKIPNSVTTIGERCFACCKNLEKVDIPNSVTNISEFAFQECRALTEIAIPDSITIIEPGTFNICRSLTKVYIPNSVTKIETSAFSWCDALQSILIPRSVKYIGNGVFGNCKSMKTLYIPISVETVGDSLGGGKSIQQVIVMCNNPFDFEIPDDSPLMNIEKSNHITLPLEWYRIVLKGNMNVKQNTIHSIKDKGKTVSLEDVFEDRGMKEAIYKGKTGNELYTGNDIEIPENYFNLDEIDASIQYQLLGNPTSSNTKIVNNQLYIGADERASDLRVTATVLNTTSQEVPIKILPLSSIEIVSEPLKQYIEGESYNPEGLVIKIRYHDGYEENIAYNEETKNDFYFTYDNLSLLTKEQVISYGGQNVKHQLIILPKYIDQILKDDKHLISVQGIITRDGYLIVHKVENQYSAGLEDKKIIGEYEIEMIGEYKGKLFISFDVGADNNGRTVYVRYLNRDGEYRSIHETAINGKIGIYVDELSSFVIYADNELTDYPEINQNISNNEYINTQEMSTVQTNDNTNIAIHMIIISTMMSVIIMLGRNRMKKDS